jgi:hypothetical protein
MSPTDSNILADKCKTAGLFERLTLLEGQFPGGSVLMHKLGILPKVQQHSKAFTFSYMSSD